MIKYAFGATVIAIASLIWNVADRNLDRDKARQIEAKSFLRDYQIEVLPDIILMYDGEKYVGSIPYNPSDEMWKIILFDNQ